MSWIAVMTRTYRVRPRRSSAAALARRGHRRGGRDIFDDRGRRVNRFGLPRVTP